MKLFGMCFHNYKFIFTGGANRYLECKCCGKRKIIFGCGYSAIDWTWLRGGKKTEAPYECDIM